ncbi:hypothetical protein SAMN03159443_00880 [Pseudomonas sp. NFACC15-1]|nr:hypothetical protein SAMN03159443_00880 [Pseudomonas sp. NFACC15-1]SDX25877.1 hypothetical protein SAMN03159380_01955 [Pseudomonas sp. NFACC14]
MNISGMHNAEASPRHCGSELARDDGHSFNRIATDPPLSRASSLPQGVCMFLGAEVSA